MKYETTRFLVDLAANVSHDPEQADWRDVQEALETIQNPASVLEDLLQYMHKELL